MRILVRANTTRPFDNGTTCVLYRTEAVRFSVIEGAFISEEDYEKAHN